MEQFEVARKCICSIQQFNGSTSDLPNFIKRVESLSTIMEPLTVELKRILLGYIEDRLVGKARDSLSRNGQVQTWMELRAMLIREHGDHTPKEKILDEITLCRCTNGIGNFYSELNQLLVRLNNSYLLDDSLTTLQATRNKNMVLETFKRNLPEPVKGIIISRNPSTMAEAYAIIEENGYLNFTGLSFNVTNYQNRKKFQNINSEGYTRNGSGTRGFRSQQGGGNFRQIDDFQPRNRNQGNNYRNVSPAGSSQTRRDNFTGQSRRFNNPQYGQNTPNQIVEPMDISNTFQNFHIGGRQDTCPI